MRFASQHYKLTSNALLKDETLQSCKEFGIADQDEFVDLVINTGEHIVKSDILCFYFKLGRFSSFKVRGCEICAISQAIIYSGRY